MSNLTRCLRRLLPAALFACALALTGGAAQATHNSGSSGGGGSSAPSSGKELVVYDWNKPVTKAHKGFPWFEPPQQNGNWKSPVNYAEGTYHIRVQIKKQPKAQNNMRIQFCLWQDNLKTENCSDSAAVKGTSGNVVTWTTPVSRMWKRNGKSIDYSRPRQRIAAAIWNQRLPVSSFGGFKWAGENPDNWYPLDMRMTIVLVAKGSTFSGWNKFIK